MEDSDHTLDREEIKVREVFLLVFKLCYSQLTSYTKFPFFSSIFNLNGFLSFSPPIRMRYEFLFLPLLI